MADTLLATTWDNTNSQGRLYVGDLNSPGNLVQKHVGSVHWYGVDIDNGNALRMLAAGEQTMLRSIDGGTTWAAPAIGVPITSAPLRKVQFAGASNAYYLNKKVLYRSVDNGSNWTGITPVVTSGVLMDVHMVDASNGFLLYTRSTPFTGGGLVLKTTNGGTSWASAFDLSTEPDWTPRESPRRIWSSADQLLLYILTSHGLWKAEYLMSSWALSRLWDIPLAIQTQGTLGFIDAGNNNGWSPGYTTDNIKLFDDLQVDEASERIWLGGNYGLRAHSFDELTWLFTDIASVESSGSLNNRFHSMYNGSAGFVGSSKLSPYADPNEQGIWKSVNAGVSTSLFKVFDPKESLQDMDAFRVVTASGCTVEGSCNYDNTATSDDGSCQRAVKLTECSSGQIIHTISPQLSALTCRFPRFGVDIQGVHSLFAGYSATITINGTQVFAYNHVVDMGMTVEERLATFIAALIFQINSTTALTATPIPPSQNPFIPNSANGIWVECDSVGCSGQQVIFSQGGLTGVDFSQFDNGSLGSIVVLAEYPGKCWSVCGDGDCSLAAQLTLIGTYPDCYRCVPFDAPTACRDCDTVLTVNGASAYTSPENWHKQCLSVGQTMHFDINVGFPTPGSNTFLVVNPGSACSTGCPLTVQVSGNHVADFVQGSGFTVNAGIEIYTVASVSYDQNGDVTTIVSAEACQNGATFTSITSFASCECSVRLKAMNVTSDTTLMDQVYPCVGGLVSQVLDYMVLLPGEISVTITAQDCATTRVCQYWFDVCDALNVCETDCHTYRLQARTTMPPTVVYAVNFREALTNKLVGQEYEFTGAEMNAGVTVVTPRDGIYTMYVQSNAGTVPERYEIFDLCDAEKCRTKLVEKVFCTSNDPCDPTCTDCDSDRAENRYLYTRIGTAWSLIDKYIFNHRTKWLNGWYEPAARQAELAALANSLSCLMAIASSCGECGQPTDSKPCTTCS